MKKILSLAWVCVQSAWLVGQASATTVEIIPPAEEKISVVGQGGQEKPYGAAVTLSTSVGIGSFVKVGSLDTTHSLVTQGLSLSPFYNYQIFGRQMRLSLGWSVDYEFTQPNNPTGRRIDYSDISVGFSFPQIVTIPRVEVSVGSSATLAIPVSRPSLAADKYLGANLGATLSRDFKLLGIGFLYAFGVTKNVHRSKMILVDPALFQDYPYAWARDTDSLVSGRLPLGDPLTEWALSNQLTLSYAPPAVTWLSCSLSLGVSNSWKYELYGERDELTAENAKTGRGRLDSTNGGFEVSLSPSKRYAVSLGLISVQPAKKADNASFYSPIFNFASAAANYTRLYLALKGNF